MSDELKLGHLCTINRKFQVATVYLLPEGEHNFRSSPYNSKLYEHAFMAYTPETYIVLEVPFNKIRVKILGAKGVGWDIEKLS